MNQQLTAVWLSLQIWCRTNLAVLGGLILLFWQSDILNTVTVALGGGISMISSLPVLLVLYFLLDWLEGRFSADDAWIYLGTTVLIICGIYGLAIYQWFQIPKNGWVYLPFIILPASGALSLFSLRQKLTRFFSHQSSSH